MSNQQPKQLEPGDKKKKKHKRKRSHKKFNRLIGKNEIKWGGFKKN